MQLTLNRRMTQGLQFGIAYTFSKTLGLADNDFDTQTAYFSFRERDYGLLGWDRPHAFVINYSYQVPSLGRMWNNKVADAVLGGWQISGITTFAGGSPLNPGFSTVDGAEITGSSDGARIDLVGDPYLPKSERTWSRNFNTEAFARPAVRSFGNAGIGYLRSPGTNNWDLTISKRVPLGADNSRYFQFRTELFNAFNHTQYSGYDTGARFDAAGKQVNANFGAYNGARDPRRIQLSLRIMF
jgi:hypothetical protein